MTTLRLDYTFLQKDSLIETDLGQTVYVAGVKLKAQIKGDNHQSFLRGFAFYSEENSLNEPDVPITRKTKLAFIAQDML